MKHRWIPIISSSLILAILLIGFNLAEKKLGNISTVNIKAHKFEWEKQRLEYINTLTTRKPSQESINKMISNYEKNEQYLKSNGKSITPVEKSVLNDLKDSWIINFFKIKEVLAAYLFGMEGFEGASYPDSFDNEGGWGSSTIGPDATSKITGTYSAIVAATGEGGAYLYKDYGDAISEVYVQFKIYLPNGWDFDSGTYLGLLGIDADVEEPDDFYMNLEDWGSNFEITFGGDVAYTDSGKQLSPNNTYTIQVGLKRNDTTGFIKLWINNTTEGSPDYNSGNKNTSAGGLEYLWIGNTYTDNSFDAFYIDDIIVDSSFIEESLPSTDTCNPPASGDWYVQASDNCYVTTTRYVIGDLIILTTEGPGTFNLIDSAVIAVKNLKNTSTPIRAEAGTYIKFWTPQ